MLAHNRYVEVPRIKVEKSVETLINEEVLLLAKFLRTERKTGSLESGFELHTQ